MRTFLALALCAGTATAQEAVLRGAYVWENDDPAFGGFSGIEVASDGSQFFAISDRGHLATGRLLRDQGVISGVALEGLVRLRGRARVPLPHAESDSEGLALGPDGRLFISFEWTHGLRELLSEIGETGPLLVAEAFGDMQTNSSLEAVAIDAEGALYTIPERSGRAARPFPVYRLKDSDWDMPFVIPRRGAFLVSGADIGPDGRFYLLERDFLGLGFRSRVRRFEMDGTGETTLLETRLFAHDNLEGISVWQDSDSLVMTLISDDNFRALQRTEIVEYLLTQD